MLLCASVRKLQAAKLTCLSYNFVWVCGLCSHFSPSHSPQKKPSALGPKGGKIGLRQGGEELRKGSLLHARGGRNSAFVALHKNLCLLCHKKRRRAMERGAGRRTKLGWCRKKGRHKVKYYCRQARGLGPSALACLSLFLSWPLKKLGTKNRAVFFPTCVYSSIPQVGGLVEQ